MAPGVTTMAITRKAPTVIRAATVQALSSVKNRTFSRRGLRPIERAWLSSKKVTIRSFHFASRIVIETPPIKTICTVSSGVIARMLPKMIVLMSIGVGESELMKSPIPKKPVKIRPITASCFRRVRWPMNSMAMAASPPDRKAPSA